MTTTRTEPACRNPLSEREKHLTWCKQRALEYVDAGDVAGALASMIQDMGMRDDTALDPFLSMMGMAESQRGAEAMRRWVEGFN